MATIRCVGSAAAAQFYLVRHTSSLHASTRLQELVLLEEKISLRQLACPNLVFTQVAMIC